MNEKDRLIFYLGDFYDNEKKYKNGINVDKLEKKYSQTSGVYNNYVKPFKNLLKKTDNMNKRFSIELGDIHHIMKENTFAKNRHCNSNSGILLRLFNYGRHWNGVYDKSQDIPFDSKKNIVLWRGASTGQGCETNKNYLPRFQLLHRWCDKSSLINVGFSLLVQRGKKEEYRKYLKGNCDKRTMLKHKYILSVEGNDKDTGLNWKLNSNSVVFMTKPKTSSWLMETKLVPNVHYILIKDDFSDLEQKVQWCNKNQHKCKEIIKNANNFMKQFKNDEFEKNLEAKIVKYYFDNCKFEDDSI